MLDYKSNAFQQIRLSADLANARIAIGDLMASTIAADGRRSISLIMLADENCDEAIETVSRQFADLNWDYELLIAGTAERLEQLPILTTKATGNEQIRLLKLSDPSQPVECQAISQAIKISGNQWIAITDADIPVDSLLWKWLAHLTQERGIGLCYERSYGGNLLTKLMLIAYAFITRVLLRTSFHAHRKGLLIIRNDKAELAKLPLKQLRTKTDLVAVAKLNQQQVVEIGIERSGPAASQAPKFRQIVKSSGHSMRFWWNVFMFPGRQETEGATLETCNPETKVTTVKRDADGLAFNNRCWTRFAAWTVLIAASLFALSNNLAYPLFEPDEARNAQIGLEIYESGQWMTLTLAGEHYWDKPPLVAWATAISYHTFGVTAFSTRLPCNLAAFMTVMVTLLLGQRLIGFRAAWLAALLLLMSTGFVMAGRYVTMDAALTMCATTMLLAGYLACRSNKNALGWWLLAGIACGVGLLVKGPVIAVVGLPPLVIAFWLSENKFRFNPQSLLVFFAPIVLIAGPWFIAMSVAFFPDFMLYFFWKHHVVRFSDAFNHREAWWYYLPVIILVMYPTSLLFPSVTAFLSSSKAENRGLRTRELGFLVLIVCWVIGFFSLSQSKLPTYILPAFPALCLVVGAMLDRTRFLSLPTIEVGKRLRATPRRLAFSIMSVTATAYGVMWIVFPKQAAVQLPLALAFSSLVFTLGLIALVTNERKVRLAWSCTAILALLFISFGTAFLMPAVSRGRSIHAGAATLSTDPVYQDSPIVFYCHENFGSSLWSPLENQLVFKQHESEEMCQYLSKHPRTLLISTQGPIDELQYALGRNILISEAAGYRHVYTTEPSVLLTEQDPSYLAKSPADENEKSR